MKDVYHEATSEQIQCWKYHNSLSPGASHQLLMLDKVIKDADILSVNRAFETMIRRHESLRTCFRVIGGEIKQCVVPYQTEIFSPSIYDMSAENDCEKAILEIIDVHRNQLTKMDSPPLIRCGLFKIPGNTWFLCILIHHLIADDWSMNLLYKELVQYYTSFIQGQEPDTAPLRIQLKDYALWQRKWLAENGTKVHDYWADKLRSLPAVYDIRGVAGTRDELLDILNNGKASSYVYAIGSRQYTRLLELSVYCRSSLLSIVNASLQLLFLLLTDREKILITMLTSSRQVPGTESIIGYLVGGVYQYMSVNQDGSITDLVQEVYIDFLESARHIIYDHDEMRLDGHALRLSTDVFVNFISKGMADKGKLVVEKDRTHLALSGQYYGMSNFITEYEDGLLCNCTYNLSLYSPETIEFMVEKQEAILQAMCENPKMTVNQLIGSLIEDNY